MYKTGDEQEKKKDGVVSHNPTGETEHRFVVLYRRMPDSGDLFFNKGTLWQRYQRGRRDRGLGWLKGKTQLRDG
jgi:hypothetical protein